MTWIVKVLLVLVLLFTTGLLVPTDIYAVTISVGDYPLSISSNIFSLTATVSGATNATNYLRVDLYKDGTTNYFGETYNGSDWYGGSDGKSYFPIQIQNSSGSAILQAQLGNPNISDYPGQGSYKLKIRRYTASGSQSQNDQQTSIDIQITYVAPTPTLDPTPSPTPVITSTPTLIPTPTKIPMPIPTKSPTPTSTSSQTPEILGESTIGPTPSPLVTFSPENKIQGKFPIVAVIFIGLGVILVGISGIIFFNGRKNLGKS